MSSMKPVDVFHVGPQKTGTTWVYQCLLDHPEIECPQKDTTHYFSMLYHRGRGWLERQYPHAAADRLLFEPTPNYFRSPLAPIRIARENPHAKIVACLRHPIARAFSHYWHEKKKRRFDFRFEEALENFDLFTNWIEPGLYALHLKRFLEHFPREQMLVQLFDDLEEDPWSFLQQLYRFIGVNDTFEPHVLHEKVNPATPRWLRFSTYRGSVELDPDAVQSPTDRHASPRPPSRSASSWPLYRASIRCGPRSPRRAE